LDHWRHNLYLMWISQMLAACAFGAITPFIPIYIQDLGLTDPRAIKLWAGLVGAAPALPMVFMAPIWGALSDRIGRKPMVLRSMFGGAVSMALFALARSVEQLLFFRIIQGMVTGVVAASFTLVATFTPEKRFGFSLGLVLSATYVGGTIGPFLGGFVADLFGFRASFLLASFFLFSGGTGVLFMVREDFTPPGPNNPGSSGHFLSGVRIVRSDVILLSAVLMLFFSRFSRAGIIPMAPLFIQGLVPGEQYLSTISGLTFSAFGAASALSSIIMGRLGDRFGHMYMLIICLIASSLLHIPQALSSSPWQFIIFHGATGFFMGGIFTNVFSIIGQKTPVEIRGSVYGVSASASAIGRTLGPLLCSRIAVYAGIRNVFFFVASTLAFSGLGIFLLQRKHPSRN